MLKHFGINLKTLDIDKFRSEYNALYSKKETLQVAYKSVEKDIRDLSRKLDNLNQYLDRTHGPQQAAGKEQTKNQTSL